MRRFQTVTTTKSRNVFNGNGVATVFNLDFVFFEATSLVVTLVQADGTQVLKTLTTDYTVSGGAGATGSVTTTSFTPASGEQLVVERVEPAIQGTDYVNNDTFDAETTETRFDRTVLALQTALDRIGRAVKLPITDDPGTPTDVTIPAPEADKFLVGKDGDEYELRTAADAGTLSIPVPVVDGGTGATTAAAARTNLDAQQDLDVVPQAEAEAGTATTERVWTAQRVSQAIAALAISGLVFNVVDEGAVGDGVADDTAAIQAAIDAAETAGGGIVFFPEGTYKTTAELLVDNDNVWLVGVGDGSVIKPTVSAGTVNAVKFAGAGLSGTVTDTLASNITGGDHDVVLVDASDFTVGDFVYIERDLSAGASAAFYTFIARIRTKVSNTITLDAAVPFSVLTGDTHQVTKIDGFVRGGGARSLKFDGTNMTATTNRGLLFEWCRGCTFESLTFEAIPQSGLHSNQGGIDNLNRDVRLYDCGDGSESDYDVRRQTNLAVKTISSEFASGFGPQLAQCSYARVEGLSSYGAGTGGNSGRGLKFNSCYRSHFADLLSVNSNSTGIAVSNGTQLCIFTRLTAFGNKSGNNPTNEIGLWLSGQSNNSNIFDGIMALGNADADIRVSSTDNTNIFCNFLTTPGTNPVIIDQGATNSFRTRFRGALVQRTGDQTIANSTWTAVSWASTVYDTDSFWSAGSPTRLTIPANKGITRVRLTILTLWTGVATGARLTSTPRNGGAGEGTIFTGMIRTSAGNAQNGRVTATSAVFDVADGDFFETRVWQDSGGNLDLQGGDGASYMMIEVIE